METLIAERPIMQVQYWLCKGQYVNADEVLWQAYEMSSIHIYIHIHIHIHLAVGSWKRGNKQIDIQLVASKSGASFENTLQPTAAQWSLHLRAPPSKLKLKLKLSEANICAK